MDVQPDPPPPSRALSACAVFGFASIGRVAFQPGRNRRRRRRSGCRGPARLPSDRPASPSVHHVRQLIAGIFTGWRAAGRGRPIESASGAWRTAARSAPCRRWARPRSRTPRMAERWPPPRRGAGRLRDALGRRTVARSVQRLPASRLCARQLIRRGRRRRADARAARPDRHRDQITPGGRPREVHGVSSTGLMVTEDSTGPVVLRQASDGSVVRSLGGSSFAASILRRRQGAGRVAKQPDCRLELGRTARCGEPSEWVRRRQRLNSSTACRWI